MPIIGRNIFPGVVLRTFFPSPIIWFLGTSLRTNNHARGRPFLLRAPSGGGCLPLPPLGHEVWYMGALHNHIDMISRKLQLSYFIVAILSKRLFSSTALYASKTNIIKSTRALCTPPCAPAPSPPHPRLALSLPSR